MFICRQVLHPWSAPARSWWRVRRCWPTLSPAASNGRPYCAKEGEKRMPRIQRLPMSRLRDQSFNRLIPNILTLLGLCAGMTAVRLALVARWELAVAAIAVAAILDALDGRIARLLDSSSKFGAELDSLADVVGFGVVPALVLYIWTMHDAGG